MSEPIAIGGELSTFSGWPDLLCGAAAAAIWIAYAWKLYIKARRDSCPLLTPSNLRRMIWCAIWIAFLFKMARGITVGPLFRVASVASVGALTVSTFTGRKYASQAHLFKLAILCLWAYITCNVIFLPHEYAITQWLMLTFTWSALYLNSTNYANLGEYFDDMWDSAIVIIVGVCLLIVFFVLCWPVLAYQPGRRVIGPFGPATGLSLSLSVLLMGYTLRRKTSPQTRGSGTHGRVSLWPVIGILAMQGATLSRGGALTSAIFLMPLIFREMKSVKYALGTCLGLAAIIFGLLQVVPDTALRDRATLSTTGRDAMFRNQHLACWETPVWGHGLSDSKVTNFSGRVWAHHASHNFFLSVFYDLGAVGALLSAAVIVVAVCNGFLVARAANQYWHIWAFLCMMAAANVENTFWYPSTFQGLFTAGLLFSVDLPLTREAGVKEPSAMESTSRLDQECLLHI